jgi:hypothetical protein
VDPEVIVVVSETVGVLFQVSVYFFSSDEF